MSNLVDVLVIKPGRHPVKEKMIGDFSTFREFINGVIDVLTLEENFDENGNSNEIFIAFDDGGKLKGLKSNRHITKDIIISGTFIVCCSDMNGEIVSLPANKLKYYYDKFFEIEEFSDEDVQADMGFTYYSW